MSKLTLLFVLALAACDGGKVSSPGDMAMTSVGGDMTSTSQNTCVPMSTRICYCLGAGQGKQSCAADGSGYKPCECTANPDAAPITILDAGAGNPCGNCNGCCNGSTCVAFASQTDSQCGAAGTTCAACGSSEECDGVSGSCLTAATSSGCDSTSCDGCCGTLNGQAYCYENNATNCGSGGGTCMACPSGTTCNGTCTDDIDPDANFRVFVSKAQVYNTDGNGNCWDNYAGFGCAQPDVFVCFAYDTGNGYLSGCTTVVDDTPVDDGGDPEDNDTTDTATWTNTGGGVIASDSSTFYIPGSAFLNGGVIVYVQDYDTLTENDLIGQASLDALTQTDGGTLNVKNFDRVVEVDFTLF